jgi:hypothetical protein
LSPALASLHVQNFDGKNVWSIVNPLPPGCDRNAEGHSKPDVPPIAAAARAADVSGTWTVLGGDADGVQVASVTTNGERFHATSSYTVRGKPYRWTMDGTIDRQGKVAVVMTHSYAGKIPYTFQLSRDGKRFSGTDIHWVRR